MITDFQFSYGDIATFLSSYPPHAPVFSDWLSDPRLDNDFDPSPRTVGQIVEHCRSRPQEGIPRIPNENGRRHYVIGIMFGVDFPIMIMMPVEDD